MFSPISPVNDKKHRDRQFMKKKNIITTPPVHPASFKKFPLPTRSSYLHPEKNLP
jgi:hypothetical protein